MPVYQLTDEIAFPDPARATTEGLLAVGGDLRPERILLAYRHGIFPWFSDGQPILWWSPSPRLLLLPQEFHVGRTLRKRARKQPFVITFDRAFDRVIQACATTARANQDGTWITTSMQDAYIELHRQGYAHSVESWCDGELVGGLYGLSLGTAFFGESMFARADDASKLAFVALVEQLRTWAFSFVDCQVVTDHLVRFGAREFDRADFHARLRSAVSALTRRGPWSI